MFTDKKKNLSARVTLILPWFLIEFANIAIAPSSRHSGGKQKLEKRFFSKTVFLIL